MGAVGTPRDGEEVVSVFNLVEDSLRTLKNKWRSRSKRWSSRAPWSVSQHNRWGGVLRGTGQGCVSRAEMGAMTGVFRM